MPLDEGDVATEPPQQSGGHQTHGTGAENNNIVHGTLFDHWAV